MTHQVQIEMDPIHTIREILAANGVDLLSPLGQRLEATLTAREETIADVLRLAGVQFGLEPAIVAEVLMTAGLGRAPTTEQRAEVHRQFHATLERWRREFGTGMDS